MTIKKGYPRQIVAGPR